MTNQTNRENKLKLFLLKHQDYVPSNELANLMKTSTKTVYRLVKKINANFPNGKLILSEKGRGYKLDYEKFIEQTKVTNCSSIDITPSERQDKIMEELLLSSPKAVKIADLLLDYYVGDSAIANDEKVIASRIEKFDLQLMRKNRTLMIKGREENIRRAITEHIQRFNIIDIDEIKSAKVFSFNRYDVLFVSEQLRFIEKNLGGNIPYPYNVNIFSHLYILISRSRKVNNQIQEEKLTNEQLQSLDNDIIIHNVAIKVIRNVEAYLGTRFPLSEIYYLYQYMASSRMENVSKQVQSFTDEVNEITQFYLEKGGEKLSIHATNEMIFIDLANHVKPMLNRLRNQIQVKNALLDQIQFTYEHIFNSIAEVSAEASEKFNLPPISKDETGFITLYFARLIETYRLPIQTLIMCTTGVGTAELLKAKIDKKFPELIVVDLISTKNYHSVLEKSPGIKLILTTIAIKDDLSVETLLVSAMLTKDDQSRIQRKIEEIYNEK